MFSYTGLVGLSINLAALPVLVSKQPLKNWVYRLDFVLAAPYFELFLISVLTKSFLGDDDHVTISATGYIKRNKQNVEFDFV